jgi:hypothetical protein
MEMVGVQEVEVETKELNIEEEGISLFIQFIIIKFFIFIILIIVFCF